MLPDGDWKHVFPILRPEFFPCLPNDVRSHGPCRLFNLALRAQEYTAQEIVDSGHRFFGATSGGLATVVEKIFSSYGLPNGYLLGEEGSGALIGGLTYGEGTLYTKNAGDHKVFWQGPSLGWDFGGEGSRSHDAGLQSRRCSQPLQPFRRRCRLRLCRGWRRLQRDEEQGNMLLVPSAPASAPGLASMSAISS